MATLEDLERELVKTATEARKTVMVGIFVLGMLFGIFLCLVRDLVFK